MLTVKIDLNALAGVFKQDITAVRDLATLGVVEATHATRRKIDADLASARPKDVTEFRLMPSTTLDEAVFAQEDAQRWPAGAPRYTEGKTWSAILKDVAFHWRGRGFQSQQLFALAHRIRRRSLYLTRARAYFQASERAIIDTFSKSLVQWMQGRLAKAK